MILCGYKQKNTVKTATDTGQINAFTTIITSTTMVTPFADAKITILIKLLSEYCLLSMFEDH